MTTASGDVQALEVHHMDFNGTRTVVGFNEQHSSPCSSLEEAVHMINLSAAPAPEMLERGPPPENCMSEAACAEILERLSCSSGMNTSIISSWSRQTSSTSSANPDINDLKNCINTITNNGAATRGCNPASASNCVLTNSEQLQTLQQLATQGHAAPADFMDRQRCEGQNLGSSNCYTPTPLQCPAHVPCTCKMRQSFRMLKINTPMLLPLVVQQLPVVQLESRGQEHDADKCLLTNPTESYVVENKMTSSGGLSMPRSSYRYSDGVPSSTSQQLPFDSIGSPSAPLWDDVEQHADGDKNECEKSFADVLPQTPSTSRLSAFSTQCGGGEGSSSGEFHVFTSDSNLTSEHGGEDNDTGAGAYQQQRQSMASGRGVMQNQFYYGRYVPARAPRENPETRNWPLFSRSNCVRTPLPDDFGRKCISSIIIRNISNKYYRDEFLEDLIEVCALRKCQIAYFYVPVDIQTNQSLGYAHVCFWIPQDACNVACILHGGQFERHYTMNGNNSVSHTATANGDASTDLLEGGSSSSSTSAAGVGDDERIHTIEKQETNMNYAGAGLTFSSGSYNDWAPDRDVDRCDERPILLTSYVIEEEYRKMCAQAETGCQQWGSWSQNHRHSYDNQQPYRGQTSSSYNSFSWTSGSYQEVRDVEHSNTFSCMTGYNDQLHQQHEYTYSNASDQEPILLSSSGGSSDVEQILPSSCGRGSYNQHSSTSTIGAGVLLTA
eukprot:g9287.t1